MSEIELSAKFRVLMEILRVAEGVGDKVLIFSQYLTTLDLVEDFLAEVDRKATTETVGSARGSKGRYQPGIDYFRFDGSTKANIRQDQCDKFNKNSTAKLFLISIKAGGLGINLHGANRVVIFDASWNPSQDFQAIFRVYRFGQTKPSYVYRLLSRGTMEEKVYNRQVVKLSLSCRVVDEQQIERHYHYEDLQKMYHFDRNDPTERPIPIIPKDKLLTGLLQSHQDCVFSYWEHDSLLENNDEEELTDEAKKIAWEEFNNEATFEKSFTDGNGDWCIYTMKRLRQLHPLEDIAVLEATVKDLIRIFRQLLCKYRELTQLTAKMPGGTPDARIVVVENFKNYTNEICETYRNQLNFKDINYLSKTWIKLLRLSLNSTTYTEGSEGPIPIVQLRSDESDDEDGTRTCVDVIRDCMNVIRHIGGTSFTRFRIEADEDCDPDEWRKAFAEFIELVGSSTTFLSLYWQEGENTSLLSSADLRRLIFQQTPSLTTLYIRPNNYIEVEREDEQRVMEPIPNLRPIKFSSPFSPLVPQLSTKIPNLKLFNFGFADQEPTACSKLISDIILRAAGLERLLLPSPMRTSIEWGEKSNGYENYTEFLLGTLTHVQDSKIKTSIPKLKELRIGEVNRAILKILLTLADRKKNAIRLEVFCMPVTGAGWNYEAVDDTNCRKMGQILRKFLVKQSPTLKELNLWLCPWSNRRDTFYDNLVVPINLPQLEELHTLEVVRRNERYYGINFDLQYEGATFAASFPSLNKLSYYLQQLGLDNEHENDAGEQEEGKDDEEVRLKISAISHPRVTYLKMEANLKQLVLLPENFAAVTHLDLHVILSVNADPSTSQPDRISRIWTLWPATLTHLKLYVCGRFRGKESYGPDEFLTGVPVARMPELKAEAAGVNIGSLTLGERETLVNKYKTWPGISNLRRLEEFHLKWSWDTLSRGVPAKQLTETGVHFGLLIAGRQLECIVVQGMEFPVVSRECAPLLKSIYGHHVIIDRECER